MNGATIMAGMLTAAICIKKNIELDWYIFWLLIAGRRLLLISSN
jgi:hypothetical protein